MLDKGPVPLAKRYRTDDLSLPGDREGRLSPVPIATLGETEDVDRRVTDTTSPFHHTDGEGKGDWYNRSLPPHWGREKGGWWNQSLPPHLGREERGQWSQSLAPHLGREEGSWWNQTPLLHWPRRERREAPTSPFRHTRAKRGEANACPLQHNWRESYISVVSTFNVSWLGLRWCLRPGFVIFSPSI